VFVGPFEGRERREKAGDSASGSGAVGGDATIVEAGIEDGD
jgi:hypothetical protein